jgi:hypothetical protein
MPKRASKGSSDPVEGRLPFEELLVAPEELVVAAAPELWAAFGSWSEILFGADELF